MRDIEFYAQVFGLVNPWFVDDVDLSVEKKRVDITVSHHEGRMWPCLTCEVELPVFDHAEMRAWLHLDTGGFPTRLHARPPRVKCPPMGCARSVSRGLSLAAASSRPLSALPST
jgi:transposase